MRDGADNPSEFDFIDKIIPDHDSFEIKFGRFLEIDTSDKTPEEVAEIIKKEIVR